MNDFPDNIPEMPVRMERARDNILDEVTASLCEAMPGIWRKPAHGSSMPSLHNLREVMERVKASIFPAYFSKAQYPESSLPYHMAANLDSILRLLSTEIVAGLCFDCANTRETCAGCEKRGHDCALAFMGKLPEIRALLARDAIAAYEGDPAARSPGEAIFCYPSISAMLHHRVAHELFLLGVPLIPRIISEMAHSATGIDIHPGARIGKDFFIDHGTGVVIGETCVIGGHCRIYQGVTLGALSFPKNPDGTLTKGIPRHPILEDDVTVYAGATILGRVTIGKGAIIGGNVWVTEDVPPGAIISQGNKNV